MQNWLISFVEKVGIRKAKILLQSTGEISKEWKNKNATSLGNSKIYKKMTTKPLDRKMMEFYLKEIERKHFRLSLAHQTKFLQQVDSLNHVFSRDLRYSVKTQRHGAIILTKKFSYLHIWTSEIIEKLEAQLNYRQRSVEKMTKKMLVTFVQDPIDHFLSGWVECGQRWNMYHSKKNMNQNIEENQIFYHHEGHLYEDLIRNYLSHVKKWVEVEQGNYECTKSNSSICWSCARHSFPQANFLFDSMGNIHSNLKLIGDFNEWVDILDSIVEFNFNYSIINNQTKKPIYTQKMFQKHPNLISNKTMLEICKFLAIDYFLFHFELPEICNGTHNIFPLKT